MFLSKKLKFNEKYKNGITAGSFISILFLVFFIAFYKNYSDYDLSLKRGAVLDERTSYKVLSKFLYFKRFIKGLFGFVP